MANGDRSRNHRTSEMPAACRTLSPRSEFVDSRRPFSSYIPLTGPALLSAARPPLLSRTRWLLTLASFIAAIAVSVYVIVASWPAEGAPLGLPWWTHLLLLAGVGGEIVFRVLKIIFSARAIGLDVSFGTSARTILGGDFAASITPSRSGAEPARFLVLTEAKVPVGGIFVILFLELFIEMVSLAVVALCVGVATRGSAPLMKGLLFAVLLYGAGVLAMGGAIALLARRHANGPPPAWVRRLGMHAGRWRRVQRSLRQLRGSVASLRQAHPGYMALALVCSILHVLARLLPLPVIVMSYGGGVALGPMLLWPLLLLYGAAVAPVPGGGGVVEFAFKAALGGTLPARLLGASLIWWRVYTFYIYIGIGALAAGGTVMRALRRTGVGARRGNDSAPSEPEQSRRAHPSVHPDVG